jgi:hypothetical protein
MATNPTTPAPETSLHRTPAAAPPSPLSSKPFGGTTPCLISRRPGQLVCQAGRGDVSAEVSREDRLPTR